jgi:hypothetical protein
MKIVSSIGSVALFLSAFAPVAIVVPTTAAHANPSEDYCIETGGMYIKDGSDSHCEYPTVTTKPGHNPDGVQGSEETTSGSTDGQGNIFNKQESSSTCVRGNGKPC